MLTGKCKEDFDDYWLNYEIQNKTLDDIAINVFNKLPLSMQYGVYVDFFDSVGLTISETYFTLNNSFSCFIGREKRGFNAFSRQEARIKAIEKAVEIYNLNFVNKK